MEGGVSKRCGIKGGASRISHVQGEIGGGLNDQHEVGLALGEAGLVHRVSYKHVPLLWP